MKVVKLSPLEKEIHLKIGDKCTFTYHEHVSVGYTAEFEIENAEVLGHMETNTKYENAERMKSGMTGGDAAQTTFTFNSKLEGTTLLFIRKYFRFDLEEEYQFRIFVK
ncbi:MAG: hypothetical protein KC469_01575 [Flavobacteriaceae bacterium]|nr:hypothetical protein [Flavobacteriaceae bacterium]